jgi:hypothetical protein
VVKATCPVRGALGGNPLPRGNRAPSFDSIVQERWEARYRKGRS